MHMRNGGFCICRIMVDDISRAPVRHDYAKLGQLRLGKLRNKHTSMVHRKINALNLPKTPKNFQQVRFRYILCQFLNDNLLSACISANALRSTQVGSNL